MIGYFIPWLLGHERAFEREISILSHIKKAGLQVGEIRVSKFVSVVVLGEQGEMIVEMLLEWTPPSSIRSQLMDDGNLGLHELHRKLHKQVVQTVHELHNRRIVWGDVNLFNIAIHDTLNA